MHRKVPNCDVARWAAISSSAPLFLDVLAHRYESARTAATGSPGCRAGISGVGSAQVAAGMALRGSKAAATSSVKSSGGNGGKECVAALAAPLPPVWLARACPCPSTSSWMVARTVRRSVTSCATCCIAGSDKMMRPVTVPHGSTLQRTRWLPSNGWRRVQFRSFCKLCRALPSRRHSKTSLTAGEALVMLSSQSDCTGPSTVLLECLSPHTFVFLLHLAGGGKRSAM